ncbi:MAG: 4-alpha-glucanotransferase [Ilumatobacteraceae bacterium]|nr:4-alpha-glucanotransferase [Ilumatobacteraceae bacterium]
MEQPEIERSYTDASGTRQHIDSAALRKVRELVGQPTPSRGALVVRPGGEVGRATVHLETGGEIDTVRALPPDVPTGYHRISDDAGERRLIVTRGACHLPEDWRAWGWATQLYASRSRRSWGIGDFNDLEHIARWARADCAGFVMVNPLHAASPVGKQEASPYSPTSRRFLNPIYLDVDAVAASVPQSLLGANLSHLAAAGRALNDRRIIDRDRVLMLKNDALEAIWTGLEQLPSGLASFNVTNSQRVVRLGSGSTHGSNGWRDNNDAVSRRRSAWCKTCRSDSTPEGRTPGAGKN